MPSSSSSFPGRGHVYDLIVVGAGISGSELALHAARHGSDVLLVSTSLDTVYNLLGDGVALNPHPGTFMNEVHAELADERGIVGNWAMHRKAKYSLEHQAGIHLLQSSVSSLLVEGAQVAGVTTWEGVNRLSSTVVLTVGSFLKARLTSGSLEEVAGRLSEMAYDDLYHDLLGHGFVLAPLQLKAEFEDDSLPYTVDCQVFAGEEWDAESFALKRFEGLYAAGVCAAGFVTYEDAALQGVNLAKKLVEGQED